MFLDLIPASAANNNIHIKLPELWENVKTYVKIKAEHKCEYCGRAYIGTPHATEAHERWIFTKDQIILVDIVALCGACHKMNHIDKYVNRNGWDAKKKATKYYTHLFNKHIRPDGLPIDDVVSQTIIEAFEGLNFLHQQVKYELNVQSIINWYYCNITREHNPITKEEL